jgi:hypothetical protein
LPAVPPCATARHRRVAESTVPARLSYRARALDDVIFRDELMPNIFGGSVDIRKRCCPPQASSATDGSRSTRPLA